MKEHNWQTFVDFSNGVLVLGKITSVDLQSVSLNYIVVNSKIKPNAAIFMGTKQMPIDGTIMPTTVPPYTVSISALKTR